MNKYDPFNIEENPFEQKLDPLFEEKVESKPFQSRSKNFVIIFSALAVVITSTLLLSNLVNNNNNNQFIADQENINITSQKR